MGPELGGDGTSRVRPGCQQSGFDPEVTDDRVQIAEDPEDPHAGVEGSGGPVEVGESGKCEDRISNGFTYLRVDRIERAGSSRW